MTEAVKPVPDGYMRVTPHLVVDGAGCTAIMPVSEKFWGERYGKLTDPYGHEWSVATRVAEPTREEMMAAAAKIMGGPASD